MMSRFVTSEIIINDIDGLLQVIEELFGEGSVDKSIDGKNSLTAYGYRGDTRTSTIGHVAAVVRRHFISNYSNDLPIKQMADGTYRMLVSDYDVDIIPSCLGWHNIARTADGVTGKLMQIYGAHKIKKELLKMGYSLTETVQTDGTIKIGAKARTSITTGSYSLK
jgi:hypothetical protein